MTGAVLFVDDEENVLNSIDSLFIDNDMRILKAGNADEALSLFGKEEIAVIVSDHCMPGMKGTELLSKVREVSPDTFKILMTAHEDLGVAVDAINQGHVFRFIIKPWDNVSLVATVQEAAKRYQMVQSLKNVDESSFLSLAETIEFKDPFTGGHCERVAHYALMIAEELGLPEDTMQSLKFGAWLHDCGKIGIPEKILNKKTPLTDVEFDIIKKHPKWGADIALQANLAQIIINIIHYHHERYDGTGYPAGIQGNAIPVESQIVSVADVYDALTSDRSYRDKYSMEKAIKIMLAMSGNVFDPEILEVFLTKCLKIDSDILSSLAPGGFIEKRF